MNVPLPSGYVRVNRSRRCPVCGRPDWCLIHRDGGSALCPRTPSEKQRGEFGFLHVVNERVSSQRVESFERQAPRTLENIPGLIEKYEKGLGFGQCKRLAIRLGVRWEALVGLRMGWSYQFAAFTFPMYDALRRPIGIRLRNEQGQKWSIAGSRNGLFIPYYTGEMVSETNEWYVVEGPTDTAACLSLGLRAIGRPSCSSGVDMTVAFLTGKSVVIVSNYDQVKFRNDGSAFQPGQDGSTVLADALLGRAREVRVIYPVGGHKDMRSWVQAGATMDDVEALKLNANKWIRRRVP